jgi:hypothetical protein
MRSEVLTSIPLLPYVCTRKKMVIAGERWGLSAFAAKEGAL